MIGTVLFRLKPTNGISSYLHTTLVLVLPIAVLILVYSNFTELAVSIVILSKWRMLAIKPRFWISNIVSNSVDLMVGLSLTALMANSGHLGFEIGCALAYGIWLLLIKPATNEKIVSLQAFIGQFLSLVTLYIIGTDKSIFVFSLLVGLFCYLAARHFLESFEEPYAKMLSYIWAYFAASLAWLTSHWMIFYSWLSQTVLLLSVLGYGLALIYLLDHNNKLTKLLRRQIVAVMFIATFITILASNWGNKVV